LNGGGKDGHSACPGLYKTGSPPPAHPTATRTAAMGQGPAIRTPSAAANGRHGRRVSPRALVDAKTAPSGGFLFADKQGKKRSVQF
jgi:hypothetical protein